MPTFIFFSPFDPHPLFICKYFCINQEGGCMSGELWSVLLFHFSITGLRSFPIQPQNFSHIDHSCLHVQLQTSFIFLADQNFKIKNQLVLIIFKTYRDLWNSKFSFVNKSDTNILNLLFTNISQHRVGLIQSGSFRILFYWKLKHSWCEGTEIFILTDRGQVLIPSMCCLLGNKSQSRILIQDVFLSNCKLGSSWPHTHVHPLHGPLDA